MRITTGNHAAGIQALVKDTGAMRHLGNGNTGAGLLTRAVSGYDGARRNHRYIAVWKR